MSRKLKFRAWIDETCKGFNADPSYYDKNDNFIPFMIYGNDLAFEEYMPINDLLAKIPLMQYIGRTDKNGVEIYEGDIVARITSDYSRIEPNFIGVVVFKVCGFAVKSLGFTAYNWMNCEVEILGNIHENPELMEGDE